MKTNPAKQQLIDFINQVTSQNPFQVKKIQDLSTGAHYLLLLNQIAPNTVKLSKVNLKAIQEYESINNLKLLSIYLSQINAPFTFQLTKIAQKNYQDNLNLLKNLYKFYYQSMNKNSSTNQNLRDSKLSLDTQKDKKKPKIVLKGPPKIEKKQMKKIQPTNQGLKSIMKQNQQPSEQIKKILEVVQSDKNQIQAEIKLNKIKQILGLNFSYSNKKSVNSKNLVNYSTKCSGSKSGAKLSVELEIQLLKKSEKQKISKTSEKTSSNLIGLSQNHFETELKNLSKKFHCQQFGQSMLKKYDLRSSKKMISQNRKSQSNLVGWIGQDRFEDTQYENLLSPGVNHQAIKENQSKRKPIIRASQSGKSLSKQTQKSDVTNQNRKSVHFSPAGRISQRKSQFLSSNKPSKSKVDSESKKSLSNGKSPRS